MFIYALKGIKDANIKLEEIEKNNSEDIVKIKDILENFEKIQALKHCQDEKQAVELMKNYHYKFIHFPQPLLKSQLVKYFNFVMFQIIFFTFSTGLG